MLMKHDRQLNYIVCLHQGHRIIMYVGKYSVCIMLGRGGFCCNIIVQLRFTLCLKGYIEIDIVPVRVLFTHKTIKVSCCYRLVAVHK